MKRIPIQIDLDRFPAQLHPLLQNAAVYDSSCSPEARVWFIDKEDGFFLKSAPTGTLQKEAAMTDFFHSKGLGPRVLSFCTDRRDWLLTSRIPGEDCVDAAYLAQPERLCDTTAILLRRLHETPATGCPVCRTADYIQSARQGYLTRHYDETLFPDNRGYATAEQAWEAVERTAPYLQQDVLLHGDYCLPNILLDRWRFSGFIDLGSGGLGDRHMDLFWGCWSLRFNLKTDRYRERFLDAYGRDVLQPELLEAMGAFEVFL